MGDAFLDPKDQPAADRVGFDKTNHDLVAEPEGAAGPAPDQSLRPLVLHPVVAGQGRDRNQPGSAVLRRRDEQPERGDPADPGAKEGADRAGEQCRPIAVDRRALRRGSAALGRGNMLSDRGQPLPVCTGRRYLAEQRTVHQQIGVAADR